MAPLHPLWPEAAPDWLHPHLLFELLAYFLGFRLFLWLRRRQGDPVERFEHRAWTAMAAILGGGAGSKLLFSLEDPALWASWPPDWLALWSGKTIVGGLLGGLVAVEFVKRRLGTTTSTGDLLVFPLLFGMAIGRVGCFFAGVSDGTHGTVTGSILGMDLGDGLLRHPTALYEIVVLVLLAVVLAAVPGRRRGPAPVPVLVNGDLFKLFLAAYLAWRLPVEFIKTQPRPWLGLSTIQLACIAGLLYYAPHLRHIARAVRAGRQTDSG